MKRLVLILAGLLLLLLPASGFAAPVAKITVKVIDDHGTPVSGAEVTFGFTKGKAPGEGWGTVSIGVDGKTDEEGLFTAQHETSPYVTIQLRKEGYYHSGERFEPKSKFLLKRWEPWNPTIEVVLKKKRNPVGMYMKGTHGMKIPAFDKQIGFDLEKGDWVAPYGKGVIEDFIFNMHVVDRAYTDYECSFSLTFSNTHDGIQEYFFDENDQSYYKWPFEAPVEGYVSKIMKEKSMSPDKGYRSNEKKNVNYIFRVRTKIDKDGKIVKALYGKLGGEFKFSPDGEIVFGYYLNPDGTRNLEEDRGSNLFKNE